MVCLPYYYYSGSSKNKASCYRVNSDQYKGVAKNPATAKMKSFATIDNSY